MLSLLCGNVMQCNTCIAPLLFISEKIQILRFFTNKTTRLQSSQRVRQGCRKRKADAWIEVIQSWSVDTVVSIHSENLATPVVVGNGVNGGFKL